MKEIFSKKYQCYKISAKIKNIFNPNQMVKKMILVTLDLFSGRENVKWMLSPGDAHELQNLLSSVFGGKRKYIVSKESKEKIPTLGYRGFLIKGELKAGESNHSVRIYGLKNIETFLLKTGQKNLPPEIYTYVESKLNFLIEKKKDEKRHCPQCAAASAPKFGEPIWSSLTVKMNNNCYNYATNLITNTFAQPGKNSGSPFSKITGVEIEKSAISDGLISTGDFSTPLKSGHYVALVIWPNFDFHWYRQDISGCWSHKAGTTDATELDDKSKYIADPRNCDMGPYIFHSFMISSNLVSVV